MRGPEETSRHLFVVGCGQSGIPATLMQDGTGAGGCVCLLFRGLS